MTDPKKTAMAKKAPRSTSEPKPVPALESKIEPGFYRHYKGHAYEVLGVARHSENLEELVVYRESEGQLRLWVRPAKMFFEKVKRDGKTVQRFAPMKSPATP